MSFNPSGNETDNSFENKFGHAKLLKKLTNSSAIALCEDDSLREKISQMIDCIKDKKIRIELSLTPEATLPLTIAARNSDPEIQEYATDCLKHIIEAQKDNAK